MDPLILNETTRNSPVKSIVSVKVRMFLSFERRKRSLPKRKDLSSSDRLLFSPNRCRRSIWSINVVSFLVDEQIARLKRCSVRSTEIRGQFERKLESENETSDLSIERRQNKTTNWNRFARRRINIDGDTCPMKRKGFCWEREEERRPFSFWERTIDSNVKNVFCSWWSLVDDNEHPKKRLFSMTRLFVSQRYESTRERERETAMWIISRSVNFSFSFLFSYFLVFESFLHHSLCFSLMSNRCSTLRTFVKG